MSEKYKKISKYLTLIYLCGERAPLGVYFFYNFLVTYTNFMKFGNFS